MEVHVKTLDDPLARCIFDLPPGAVLPFDPDTQSLLVDVNPVLQPTQDFGITEQI